MIVVSGTSPVLNVELVASQSDLAPAIDLTSLSWLQIAAPQDQQRLRDLRENLDPGEADAIVLAIERQADLLLVDERRTTYRGFASGANHWPARSTSGGETGA